MGREGYYYARSTGAEVSQRIEACPGVWLEALVSRPRGGGGAAHLGVVLVPPHAALGGSMDAPVLELLAHRLHAALGCATVRFSHPRGRRVLRGVAGRPERDDAVAAARFALGLPGVRKVVLVGYSA